MRGSTPPSERAARLGVVSLGLGLVLLAGCTPRVLDVVDSCSDGGACGDADAGQLPILRGLVGWWPFDEGSGSGVAYDRSGNGNHGILVDLDATTAWAPGRSRTGLETRSVGYVLVPRSPSIDGITTQVTVSAWIYFEGSVSDYATAVSREVSDSVRQHYHLSLNSAEDPHLFIGTVPPGTTGPPTDLEAIALTSAPRFTWIHLAGTYDGTSAQLYVDGAPAGTSRRFAGAFIADTTPLILGGNGNGAGMGVTERFPGRIDEIMLYNRALGADEIAQLARAPLSQ
jgi:large repetitive protein